MSKIYAAKDPGITQREIDHMALSRKLAGECIVLLENDGALPLGGAGRIALYGNGARRAYTASQDAVLTAADVKAGRCTVEELTAQLTVEEMANICVGTLRKGGSIVGNASCNVPGAAGDTSPILRESRGVKNMVLADGPAGLRLQPVFRTDKAGDLLPGDLSSPLPAGYTDEDADTYYQYCTAIPIGWALAQSWNMELLREIGSMVGREMEAFGVDLWLAPALNIHRDPLCGRNKESQPLSIMTSYNLLNGIHTANHFELLQSAARDEWGFRGFIMTDWFTSQRQPALTGTGGTVYPVSASTGCVHAGNDVQMPGCQENVDDLVRAVKTGEEIDGYRLTLADLQFNAANVIRAAIATDR